MSLAFVWLNSLVKSMTLYLPFAFLEAGSLPKQYLLTVQRLRQIYLTLSCTDDCASAYLSPVLLSIRFFLPISDSTLPSSHNQIFVIGNHHYFFLSELNNLMPIGFHNQLIYVTNQNKNQDELNWFKLLIYHYIGGSDDLALHYFYDR